MEEWESDVEIERCSADFCFLFGGVFSRNFEEIPWYAEKGNVRAYLAEINKDRKVVSPSAAQHVPKLTSPGDRIHAFPTRLHCRLYRAPQHI